MPDYMDMKPITVTDAKKAVLYFPAAVPRKVDVAMNFVMMLGGHGAPRMAAISEFGKATEREMTVPEGRAYESALAVLTYYFTGEMTFEDRATVVEIDAARKDSA